MLAAVLAALLVAYRRKVLRYRQIARQQWEILRKERMLDQRYGQSEGLNEKPAAAPLPDKKIQALFAEFDKLMVDRKIYRERDITIDKIAELLGTNRSYLSQAINANGGMTFPQRINSYRIDEARRILSDKNNDIQIKTLAYELGFATPETFSTSFRKTIGMLPTKFRAEMSKMYDNGTWS